MKNEILVFCVFEMTKFVLIWCFGKITIIFCVFVFEPKQFPIKSDAHSRKIRRMCQPENLKIWWDLFFRNFAGHHAVIWATAYGRV